MQRSAVIADRILEPMDLRESEAHMGKSRNGALHPEAALADFELRIRNGDLFDHLGKHPKRKERILVVKKQQVIFREEKAKEQVVEMKGPTKKKATDKDIANALRDMDQQPKWSGQSENGSDDNDFAKRSLTAKGGAFGQEGLAMTSCPSMMMLHRRVCVFEARPSVVIQNRLAGAGFAFGRARMQCWPYLKTSQSIGNG